MEEDGAPTPLRPRGGGSGGALAEPSLAPKTGISKRETSVLQPPANPATTIAATQALLGKPGLMGPSLMGNTALNQFERTRDILHTSTHSCELIPNGLMAP